MFRRTTTPKNEPTEPKFNLDDLKINAAQRDLMHTGRFDTVGAQDMRPVR